MSDSPTEPKRCGPESELAERHYAAIGKVAVEWAELEGMLDIRAIEVAGFDTTNGMCFALQIVGPGRKLNVYMAVAELRGAKTGTLKKLRRLQQDILAVAEKRNRVIHDQWEIKPSGSPIRLELTANKTLIAEYKFHPTNAVESIRTEIRSLIERFELLDGGVLSELNSWHVKYRKDSQP
jgi:hypothetical protein